MPSPHAIPITLTAADRATLEGWTRRRKTAQALALRARIVLACTDRPPSGPPHLRPIEVITIKIASEP